MGEKEKKLSSIKKALELTFNPKLSNEIATIYDRALIFELQEDQKAALREYNAILKCENNYVRCRSDFFIAYLSTARVLIDLDQYESAQTLYEQAERLTNNNSMKEAWLNLDLGQFYEKVNEIDAAIQSYKKAIELIPDLMTPYLYRARLYEKIHVPDAAFLDYQKVVELSNHPSNAHITFAEFLYRIGHFADAIEQYNQALRYPTYDKSLIHAYIGQAYAELMQEEHALKEFDIALQTESPSKAYILSSYGVILAKFGYISNAIERLEQSLKLNPDGSIETALNLGQLYETVGEIEKAKKLYGSLLTKSNQFPDDKSQILQTRLLALTKTPTPLASP